MGRYSKQQQCSNLKMVSLPNRIDTDNLRAAHALVMQTDAKVDALELKIAKRDVALSRKFDYME